jgi:hypothetical protein
MPYLGAIPRANWRGDLSNNVARKGTPRPDELAGDRYQSWINREFTNNGHAENVSGTSLSSLQICG